MGDRTVVILQPGYLPWLGFFEQLWRADVFVLYDDVQYDRESWRNRNRVKTAGGVRWLTVPVLTRALGRPRTRDVRIDNRRPWRRKHLETLRHAYAPAPYFAAYAGRFAALYDQPWERLVDLNAAAQRLLMDLLGLERAVIPASSLGIAGGRVDRLVAICRALGATRFYEGAAGRAYLDPAAFAAAGIALEFQDYRHPVYPQLHGPFVSHLSVVDLLFNCGPDSLRILAR
jgi:hypothetical protein